MTFNCITTKDINYKKSTILKQELEIQVSLNINILYQIVDNYLLKENGPSHISKEEYIKDIIKKIYDNHNLKIKRLERKKNIKEKKNNEEDIEKSNKMSYLHDLMYFKKLEKKKDIIKYFEGEDNKKKIIYL